MSTGEIADHYAITKTADHGGEKHGRDQRTGIRLAQVEHHAPRLSQQGLDSAQESANGHLFPGVFLQWRSGGSGPGDRQIQHGRERRWNVVTHIFIL
jgi:hypothetical protein